MLISQQLEHLNLHRCCHELLLNMDRIREHLVDIFQRLLEIIHFNFASIDTLNFGLSAFGSSSKRTVKVTSGSAPRTLFCFKIRSYAPLKHEA